MILKYVFALLSLSYVALASEPEYDVLVYGGSPGGVAAAVAAAKAGRSVLLIEPYRRVGGLMTNGLSYSDFRSFEALTGFFLEFTQRVEADYRERYGADSPQVADSLRGTHGEPSVNQRVFDAMLNERGVSTRTQWTLDRVERTPLLHGRQRMVAVHLRSGDGTAMRVTARQFIDGTYEGDLMAAAGESFHVGREARSQYGEPLAGDVHGRADGQVQGYNLRLTMTTREDNKRLPEMPAGYRRDEFADVLAHFRSGRLQRAFAAGREGIFRAQEPGLPNGKFDVNDTPKSPVRLSLPDLNDAYPTADAATRAGIINRHYYENIGLLYFLQNDPEVPESIQAETRQWGFCRDEFVDNGGLPEQIYVREARRMVGQHVFTIADTRTAPRDARSVLHSDSIAAGDYIHNCHGTGRRGSRYDGEHEGEFYDFIQPYQIRYGVIVPQLTENLLVPVACSASHFGFSALRLEPIWSALGQAAGWAAHLAMETESPVQHVDVPKLQQLLHRDRSATIYVTDVAPDAREFEAVQWFGNRGGLHGLVDLDGVRAPARIAGQYVEGFPDHAVNLDAPMSTELENKWRGLLPPGVEAPETASSRGEWLLAAYAAWLGRQP